MAAKKRLKSLRCPSCRKSVLKGDVEFPFCSVRCRTIDLGKWASNGYVISTPVADPEEMLDAEVKLKRLRELTSESDEDPGRPN